MKPYKTQELEACGFFSKMFGSAPTENGWKELNNLLAKAETITALSADDVRNALKKWGVKFNEENIKERSSLYRKLADVVYSEAQSKEDSLFQQLSHLAEILELPPHMVHLADKGAKTAAYFIRCRKLLSNEEALSINQINELFGYDYEDGFSIRKQVFQDYFNLKFEDISKTARFTPDEEQSLRNDCEKLAIPYEFKSNISNALENYRNLWNAEHQPLGDIKQEAFPLNKDEICHAYANCALCQNKVVEREDNYFELTRKFSIDETVAFKGEKIEHPKFKEEMVVIVELGHFFLTNQRVIFIGKKNAFNIMLHDITSSEFDGATLLTFHTHNSNNENLDVIVKFSDEAAGVMHILFERTLKTKQ